MNGFDEPRQTDASAEMPVTTPPSGPPTDDLDRTIADLAAELKHRLGVHGVGRGYGTPGKDTIVVFVDHENIGEELPKEVDGYPVMIEVVEGGFRAQ